MTNLLLASPISLLLAAAVSPTAHGATRRELAAMPWDNLVASLPSGATQLQEATFEGWAKDCLPMFLPTNPDENKSTYYLIDKPSGLCMAVHWCIWERCSPDRPYLQSESSYLEWADKFDVYQTETLVEYITGGFGDGPNNWHNSTNPWLQIPYKTLFPKVPGDVVAAVKFAKENGLELSVKNSGHSFLASSTKKNTLLLNMNQFKRYAYDDLDSFGVQDCTSVDPAEAIVPDLSNQPCVLSAAKGKPGVIRVGGGENWDKTYRSVKAANEALPDGYRYHVVGGNSATVSPMGWTWSGGLAATTGGRLFGFGVDQVVQIEAVLPNGELVRFGPTEWEDAEGYSVPRTTAASGVCLSNPEANEDTWVWSECTQDINFDDLWFAFRGGGGGTWGIVTSTTIQLHPYLPFETVFFAPGHSEALTNAMTPLVGRFVLDFMVDPESIGVTQEQSAACGSASPASGIFWFCYGEGAAVVFVAAFNEFMSSKTDALATAGISPEDIEIAQTSYLSTVALVDFATLNLAYSVGTPYEGKLKDDGNNFYWANMEGELNILVPTSWILENKDRFIELLVPAPGGIGNLYYAFGGNTEFSHDQTSALSTAHRQAAFMFNFKDSLQMVQYNEMLQEMFDFSGAEFPAYLGANHLGPSAYGPLKGDWTTPCPLSYKRKESEDLCVPGQQAVWGTQGLLRLEAIKKNIDPDGMLNCFRCVGHSVSFDVSDNMEDQEEINPTDPPSVSNAEDMEDQEEINPTDPPSVSNAEDLSKESSVGSRKDEVIVSLASAAFVMCVSILFL